MAAQSARLRLTPRGQAVIAALVVALVVALVFALKPKPAEDTSVPSYDDPIGTLDTSKVPNGWADDVIAASHESGVPAAIIAAQLETESNWNPSAESAAGARGLAQFTPDAWDTYGKGDPMNPKDAIAAQGRLLKRLMQRADASGIDDNHIRLALAGYNAGFENVIKHQGVPPFAETQGYVDRIAKRKGYYALPIPSPSASPSASR